MFTKAHAQFTFMTEQPKQQQKIVSLLFLNRF